MITTARVAPDIDVLTSSFQIPGMGFVPINAYVLHGPEPILVDTGAVVERAAFLTALRSVIDPAELRWIFITHPDPDHIGALPTLLADNPDLKVVTTFLSVGMLSLVDPLPMERVHLLNPGQRLDLGDRTITALRPPVFDNPATLGFHDDRSGALFSSDCFGALLGAVPAAADDLTDDELRDGQVLWASIDSPWLHSVDRSAFARTLAGVRAIDPAVVLSSHLPVASGAMVDRLLASLEAVPDATPFVGPDQAGLEHLLAGLAVPASP